MSDLVQRSGLTLVEGAPKFWSSDVLGTTVTQVDLSDPSDPLVIARRVVVVNGSTTNTVGIAWAVSTPSAFTADYDPTTGLCMHIPPGDAREITLSAALSLFIVASGSNTTANATSFSLR